MWSLLLCAAALFCGAYGQAGPVVINTTTLSGQVGDTVYYSCNIRIEEEGGSIGPEIYDSGAFVDFVNARLMRNNSGSFAFFSFGPLRAEDDGTMLRCSGAVDQPPSDVATIFVTFAPVITRDSPTGDPLERREGQALTVMLNVTGNPQPQFTWTKDGGSLPSNGVTAALESITFNPVLRDHSGVYRLEARNSAGNTSYSFTLDVQYPPKFIGAPYPPDNVNCTQDGATCTFECAAYPGTPTVMFNCAADGNPTPTVVTTHPELTTNDIITISPVTVANAGLYSCIAASSEYLQNNDTRSFCFYVGGAATPVSNARTSIIEGVVYAVWTYNNSVNAVPGRYFVVTVFQDSTQIGNSTQVPITQRNATVQTDLLVRGQMYTVQVAVRNLQGVSETVSSEEFTFSGAVGGSVSNLLTFLLVVGLMFALL